MTFGKRGRVSGNVHDEELKVVEPDPAPFDFSWPESEEETLLGDAHIGQQVVTIHILEAVERFLNSGEKLLAAFHGTALAREQYGASAQRKGGFAIHDYLLVTDQRVITWARGVFKHSTDAFFFSDISSAEATRGLLLGEIVLNIHGARERFANMVADDANIAADLIRKKIAEVRKGPASPTQATDPVAQLERLLSLKERGALSDQEYRSAKEKIMSQF